MIDIEKLMVSLEEDAAGIFNEEIEYVFYARITNFKQLEKADRRIFQEQWEIKLPFTKDNAAKGSMRVRCIKESGQPTQYVFTSKISLNEAGDKMEVSIDSTPEQFIIFKFLAAQGMIKDRYVFDAGNGLKWEIDVFHDPDGGYYQWCKIDFEVPDRDTPIPEFPIDFADVIKGGHHLVRGSADDKKISDLYDKYFLTKNVFRKEIDTKVDRESRKDLENKVQEEVIFD